MPHPAPRALPENAGLAFVGDGGFSMLMAEFATGGFGMRPFNAR